MNRQRVTIAIPAYNEENNIVHLLRNLLDQKVKGFVIDSIQVVSDGSTDKTVDKVKNMKSNLIHITSFPQRKGRGTVQNYMFRTINTGAIVLLDADTIITQKDFLSKLIGPILNGADLTSARVKELKPHSFVEKILYSSMQWKKELFEAIKKGDNVYTCHGRARAFSKRLYKRIIFKKSVGEDAYSYFFCKKRDFKYTYVKGAKIYYKLPNSLKDHIAQSKRYFNSKYLFFSEFGRSFIENQYILPGKKVVLVYIKNCIKNPWLLLYFPLAIVTKLISLIDQSVPNTWTISQSSKIITNI